MSSFVCAILFPHGTIAIESLGRLFDPRRTTVRAG
jgi:hypothetical protein